MAYLDLETPLSEVRGIGGRLAEKFEKLGKHTVRDLLYHFPVRYDDWSVATPTHAVVPGTSATIAGSVERVGIKGNWARRMLFVEAILRDDFGTLPAVWFNQPYLKRSIPAGARGYFTGKILLRGGRPYLANPAFELVEEEDVLGSGLLGLRPVYPETRGLTSKTIRAAVRRLLVELRDIPEYIPESVRARFARGSVRDALRAIHEPASIEEAEKARNRFAFEEVFALQLVALREKLRLSGERAPVIPQDTHLVRELLGALPYTLTFSQKRSLLEIVRDMERPHPMNRLLQGDVGSGKTVVVAVAAIVAAKAGYQSTFMAPTEVLATQHYETFRKFFANLEIPVALVTAKTARASYGEGLESKIKKAKLLDEIEAGRISIVIGTHALIAKGHMKTTRETGSMKQVRFRTLALVVVDEQHRFGVRQRAELLKHTPGEVTFTPHFLSMSATPIPRTLAITVFGDLDLSTIDELPAGRRPVIAKVVATENRTKAYGVIKGEIEKGRQVFVVCPRIETPEEAALEAGDGYTYEPVGRDGRAKSWDEVKTVKAEYERLEKIFSDCRLALLHGRLKAEEKERIVREFKSGSYDILVSTSVVEVGIDVPNASVMVIEDADRFGLAQLYQFKGRVGRSTHQSYCFLFTEKHDPETVQRLAALIEAKNGFELAERDLALRGPGEFLGEGQTGMPDIAMRALQNPEIVREAREAAKQLLAEDPKLERHPLLRARLDAAEGGVHRE